jgi:hypothetical protein
MDLGAPVCNKEQLYALIDAEAGILIYSLFLKKKDWDAFVVTLVAS